jgi:hypothetical protein
VQSHCVCRPGKFLFRRQFTARPTFQNHFLTQCALPGSAGWFCSRSSVGLCRLRMGNPCPATAEAAGEPTTAMPHQA